MQAWKTLTVKHIKKYMNAKTIISRRSQRLYETCTDMSQTFRFAFYFIHLSSVFFVRYLFAISTIKSAKVLVSKTTRKLLFTFGATNGGRVT